MYRSFRLLSLLTLVVSGCAQGGSGAGSAPNPANRPAWWTRDASVPTPVDPRPPTERACPPGATLYVQLWDVYALPLNPNGSPWDGVSSSTTALFCRAGADAVTSAILTSLHGQIPKAGQAFDGFVRDQFQSAIASACGIGVDWLQSSFEGPDMFVRGGEGGAMRWQTPAVQDQWRASLRTTTTGTPAEWSMYCGEETQSALIVTDQGLAVDDAMGAVGFSLAQLSPQMICMGWVLLRPFGGIAATLLRVQVDGEGQNCDGLMPTLVSEVTLPDDPTTTDAPPLGHTTNAISGR